MLQIVWVKFYKGITKTQWWRHYDFILYFWNLKFQHFVKLVMSYQPVKFQISQLSESKFTGISVRHPKNHYDVIMASLHNIWFSKSHIS